MRAARGRGRDRRVRRSRSSCAKLDEAARGRGSWCRPRSSTTPSTSWSTHLDPGDIIIDGGNSYYRDDIDRAARLEPKGIHYVDVGTSGGVFGLERGFCLMIGGEDDVVAHLDPIFTTIAPGRRRRRAHARAHRRPVDRRARLPALRAQRRRPLREDGPQRHRVRDHGRVRRGPQHPAPRRRRHRSSSRPTPRPRRCATRSTTSTTSTSRRSPRCGGAAAWSPSGCSTSPPHALVAEPRPRPTSRAGCPTRGEGRWTIHAAVDEGVPADVLSAALYARFTSRGSADFADRLLSAMRKEFGGHDEKLDQTIGETK